MITVKMIGINVRDQEASLRFFTEKLGLKVHTDAAMGPGMRWIEIVHPDGGPTLALFTPEEHQDRIGSTSNISFGCADVHKAYAELSARGVEFAGQPETAPWGSHAQFFDPDGNKYMLVSEA